MFKNESPKKLKAVEVCLNVRAHPQEPFCGGSKANGCSRRQDQETKQIKRQQEHREHTGAPTGLLQVPSSGKKMRNERLAMVSLFLCCL